MRVVPIAMTVALALGAGRTLGSSGRAGPAAVGRSAHGGHTVLEIGDSLGEDLAWGMPGALTGTGTSFVGKAVGDTGLAETWYYDWAARLRSLLVSLHPAVVIVFLGANDVENLYVGGRLLTFGSAGWARAYGNRVARLVDETVAAGAKLIWVGMPPMSTPAFSSDMQAIDHVYRSETDKEQWRSRADYLSTWHLFGPGGPLGVGAPGAGQSGPLRAPDGVHMTVAGAEVVARAVVVRLKSLHWL